MAVLPRRWTRRWRARRLDIPRSENIQRAFLALLVVVIAVGLVYLVMLRD